MNKTELRRLNEHANAGSDLASENHDYADEELHVAIIAYRHAADALAHVTADRLEVSASVVDWDESDETDPDSAALVARLTEEEGVESSSQMFILAREALDVTDGDQEAAYAILRHKQAPKSHPL
jgi:hypothetical protein